MAVTFKSDVAPLSLLYGELGWTGLQDDQVILTCTWSLAKGSSPRSRALVSCSYHMCGDLVTVALQRNGAPDPRSMDSGVGYTRVFANRKQGRMHVHWPSWWERKPQWQCDVPVPLTVACERTHPPCPQPDRHDQLTADSNTWLQMSVSKRSRASQYCVLCAPFTDMCSHHVAT